MLNLQNLKFVQAILPQVLDNASATAQVIDTLGYDDMMIEVDLGAVDIALTALKVQECDTSGGVYADVEDATFAGALPGASDDGKSYAFYINLLGRKRYFKVVATAGDGTAGVAIAAKAILDRARETPNTAAKRGHAGEVFA